jgi:hypothetical protein
MPPRGLPATLRHHRRGIGQTSSNSCSTACVTPQCYPVPAGGCPPGYTAGGATSMSQCPSANPTAVGTSAAKETGALFSAGSSIGASLLALSPATGPAAPFVAIAGALAAFATGVLGIGSGCGQTCVTATDYANYFGCVIQVNLNTYLALPTPRTPAQQAAALAVYDQAWAWLEQACGAVKGSAGSNCLSQRAAGGKYDSTGYRNVIANDPCVCEDPAPVDSVTGAATTAAGAVSSAVNAVSSVFSSVTGGSSMLVPLLVIAGIALLLAGGGNI